MVIRNPFVWSLGGGGGAAGVEVVVTVGAGGGGGEGGKCSTGTRADNKLESGK